MSEASRLEAEREREREGGGERQANLNKIDLFVYFLVCADGYYGDSCDQECGHCANSTVCNNTSGHCPTSCEVSFQPPHCKSRKN